MAVIVTVRKERRVLTVAVEDAENEDDAKQFLIGLSAGNFVSGDEESDGTSDDTGADEADNTGSSAPPAGDVGAAPPA